MNGPVDVLIIGAGASTLCRRTDFSAQNLMCVSSLIRVKKRVLIIALDPPPQLCQIDQTIERGIFGQGGKPILRRLGFVFRS
jgi:hypothetical protein